jgi:hypothetical protein
VSIRARKLGSSGAVLNGYTRNTKAILNINFPTLDSLSCAYVESGRRGWGVMQFARVHRSQAVQGIRADALLEQAGSAFHPQVRIPSLAPTHTRKIPFDCAGIRLRKGRAKPATLSDGINHSHSCHRSSAGFRLRKAHSTAPPVTIMESGQRCAVETGLVSLRKIASP